MPAADLRLACGGDRNEITPCARVDRLHAGALLIPIVACSFNVIPLVAHRRVSVEAEALKLEA